MMENAEDVRMPCGYYAILMKFSKEEQDALCIPCTALAMKFEISKRQLGSNAKISIFTDLPSPQVLLYLRVLQLLVSTRKSSRVFTWMPLVRETASVTGKATSGMFQALCTENFPPCSRCRQKRSMRFDIAGTNVERREIDVSDDHEMVRHQHEITR